VTDGGWNEPNGLLEKNNEGGSVVHGGTNGEAKKEGGKWWGGKKPKMSQKKGRDKVDRKKKRVQEKGRSTQTRGGHEGLKNPRGWFRERNELRGGHRTKKDAADESGDSCTVGEGEKWDTKKKKKREKNQGKIKGGGEMSREKKGGSWGKKWRENLGGGGEVEISMKSGASPRKED